MAKTEETTHTHTKWQGPFVDTDADQLYSALYITESRANELLEDFVFPLAKRLAKQDEYDKSVVIQKLANMVNDLQEFSFCLYSIDLTIKKFQSMDMISNLFKDLSKHFGL